MSGPNKPPVCRFTGQIFCNCSDCNKRIYKVTDNLRTQLKPGAKSLASGSDADVESLWGNDLGPTVTGDRREKKHKVDERPGSTDSEATMYPDRLGPERRDTPGSAADDKDRKKIVKQSRKYGGLNDTQGGRGPAGSMAGGSD